MRIREKTSKAGLLLFIIAYLIYIVIAMQSSPEAPNAILFVYIVACTFLFYFFSFSLSLLFSLLPLIMPTGYGGFVSIAFVFLLIPLILIFFNIKNLLLLIKRDKWYKLLLGNCLLFFVYQLFVFYQNIEGSFGNYFLNTIRYTLGVLMVIPAYYCTITDRKNLFYGILSLSLITYLFLILSIFGTVEVFAIAEVDRGLDRNLIRYGTIDMRYLVYIISYFLFAVLFFDVKNKSLRIVFILIGLLAYAYLFIALLRVPLLYTFCGGMLLLFLLKNKFRIEKKNTKRFQVAILLVMLIVLFREQFSAVIETFLGTMEYFQGKTFDGSGYSRQEIELPLLMSQFLKSPIFGVGFEAVSFNKLEIYADVDLPLLSSLARYGVVGIAIYLFRYWLVYKIFRITKTNRYLFDNYRVEVIAFYGIAAFFFAAILFKLYLVFAELSYGWAYIEYSVLIGIMFGIKKVIELKSQEYEVKKHP